MSDATDADRGGLPRLLCADLQSKKLMVTGGLARSAEDVLDRSQHCWCERTSLQTIMTRILLTASCRDGNTPLWNACEKGNVQLVEVLLSQGSKLIDTPGQVRVPECVCDV